MSCLLVSIHRIERPTIALYAFLFSPQRKLSVCTVTRDNIDFPTSRDLDNFYRVTFPPIKATGESAAMTLAQALLPILRGESLAPSRINDAARAPTGTVAKNADQGDANSVRINEDFQPAH